MQKLNPHELITASTLWCLDIQDLTVADYRAFLKHIHFISIRAHDDYFRDSVHVDYVMAVRKVAEHAGFAAFAKSNDTESVVHYGAQNAKSRKTGSGFVTGVRRTTGNATSRACYGGLPQNGGGV